MAPVKHDIAKQIRDGPGNPKKQFVEISKALFDLIKYG
jgi:hypothetical protein